MLAGILIDNLDESGIADEEMTKLLTIKSANRQVDARRHKNPGRG